MEKEPRPQGLQLKLTVVASVDYPEASDILVSFPDRWEFVDYLSREDTALYIGAMPSQEERPRSDHFYGLPAEVNRTLTTYRLYKLFRPWPMPRVRVSWDPTTQTGQVEGMSDLKLQLQPVGQAQMWKGQAFGVLWECYLGETGRKADWQDVLSRFWQAVEVDMAVERIFTQPREPTFAEGYPDFLRRLGYAADPDYPSWWSKSKPGS